MAAIRNALRTTFSLRYFRDCQDGSETGQGSSPRFPPVSSVPPAGSRHDPVPGPTTVTFPLSTSMVRAVVVDRLRVSAPAWDSTCHRIVFPSGDQIGRPLHCSSGSGWSMKRRRTAPPEALTIAGTGGSGSRITSRELSGDHSKLSLHPARLVSAMRLEAPPFMGRTKRTGLVPWPVYATSLPFGESCIACAELGSWSNWRVFFVRRSMATTPGTGCEGAVSTWVDLRYSSREKDDRLPVRCPADPVAVCVSEHLRAGDLLAPATLGVHNPDLVGSARPGVIDVRDLRAVGRPRRVTALLILSRDRGQALRVASVERGYPDRFRALPADAGWRQLRIRDQAVLARVRRRSGACASCKHEHHAGRNEQRSHLILLKVNVPVHLPVVCSKSLGTSTA